MQKIFVCAGRLQVLSFPLVYSPLLSIGYDQARYRGILARRELANKKKKKKKKKKKGGKGKRKGVKIRPR